MRLLVHLATGPADPTRVALAYLVARTAAEAGHQVDLFIAGDGTSTLRPQVRAELAGTGTGRVAEHVEALVAAGVRFHLSGRSCEARGIDAAMLADLPAELCPPTRLVELVALADRVLVY